MRTALMFLICVLRRRFSRSNAADEEACSFRVVDIYVDSKGAPLAAYHSAFP